MAKFLKELMAEEIAGWAGGVESCVMVDFRGLTAKESEDLRRALRAQGVSMNVVPNRLYRQALARAGAGDLAGDEALRALMKGPTAVVFGGDGALTAVKTLTAWNVGKKKIGIKGGILDRCVIDGAQVERLASIPDRDVLIAQVVGGIAGPLRGLVGVLSGVIRQLVYVLNAIKDKDKDKDAQAA